MPFTPHQPFRIILDILGHMVRQQVCNGAKEAGVFTVLADETKECHQERVNKHYSKVC